jgi:hypothetical protein
MDRDQALDDLKNIRQIMDRTRRTSGRYGGWFLFIAGIMWLIGFTASQFLPHDYIGWVWAVVSSLGTLAMVWVGAHATRYSSVKASPWWPFFLYWWVLGAFDVLLIRVFGIDDHAQIGLLILLTTALGYVQFGALFHWFIGAVGILMAGLAIAAFLLIPAFFYLAMAILGGGLLIASGLWMVYSGK